MDVLKGLEKKGLKRPTEFLFIYLFNYFCRERLSLSSSPEQDAERAM